jgi:hypothetical protein
MLTPEDIVDANNVDDPQDEDEDEDDDTLVDGSTATGERNVHSSLPFVANHVYYSAHQI